MSPTGEDRLDRTERLLERLVSERARLVYHHQTFAQEHRQLLTAQVVLTDRVERLAEAQIQTGARLNALIAVVNGIVEDRKHS